MTKQTDLEDRMWSRGFDRRQRNINNNLSKGTESETDYARTMIKAGLLPLLKLYNSSLIGLGEVHQG